MDEKSEPTKRKGRSTSELSPPLPPTMIEDLTRTLQDTLIEFGNRQNIVTSSNSLANKYILRELGIPLSQKKMYRDIFKFARKHAREVFMRHVTRGRIEWTDGSKTHTYGIYIFEKNPRNLVLGFVWMNPKYAWKLKSEE